MKTENMQRLWYTRKTESHQGTVIEEGTGRTVAVTYDKADAPLAANAPAMLATLRAIKALIEGEYDAPDLMTWGPLHVDPEVSILRHVEESIRDAEGR